MKRIKEINENTPVLLVKKKKKSQLKIKFKKILGDI